MVKKKAKDNIWLLGDFNLSKLIWPKSFPPQTLTAPTNKYMTVDVVLKVACFWCPFCTVSPSTSTLVLPRAEWRQQHGKNNRIYVYNKKHEVAVS